MNSLTRPWRAMATAGIALLLASWMHGASPQSQSYPERLYSEMRWRCIGPFRGGRTRAIAGVPSRPNVFYMAQVNGGVWKTDNYGRTWTPIFDDQPTGSIGAIAVAPSNPDIVYVASGEGLQRPDLSVGDGIYKSTDAGRTWTHLGLRDGQQIPQLAIDPSDPNRVYAAVLGHPYGPSQERGIFRSTDGGQTWQKILYKDENTGGSGVEIDPGNPNVIYAALWASRLGPWEDGNSYTGPNSGLFKSTDGGETWKQLTKGLPEGLIQINVTVAPSATARLYASVAAPRGSGIYRSDDAGETWTRATEDMRPSGRIGGGDLAVPKVDPKNPDIVYSASIVTWRSADGGKTWAGFRGAPGGDDYQNIWINPENPDIIFLGSDQGAIISVDGGRAWSSWYNQPTAQLFHVTADNVFPYRVCGGQQESGSVCISSRGNDGEITDRDWHPAGVIEYGYAAPDPLNPDIVYGGGRSEVSRYDRATGQVQEITPLVVRTENDRTDRTEPVMFSPVDPHVLYYASNFLYRTSDGGRAWQKISPDLTRPHPGVPASIGEMARNDANAEKQRGVIYALGPSFKDINMLWAGTDDGLIWLTRDGGKNWVDVTPPAVTAWSKVTQIVASHYDNLSAYASVSRFRIDDLHPYIYRTHDGGRTWSLIVAGLPDNAPVDVVREDPVRKGLLFAGTETAVWVSFDDGDHWQSLQLNLPHTSMRDLWIHDDDLIVATHGRAFWILDDITPLRQLSSEIASGDAYLFAPAPAVRVRWNTNTDTPLPPDEPAGKNPPDGAILDYYLGAAASGPVTLEIFDAAGKSIRRFSSSDPPEFTEAGAEKTLAIPLYWPRFPQPLSAAAGMHRFVWDLRYPTPRTTQYNFPIAAVPHDTAREPRGPWALPGRYTVKLALNGRTYEQPLVIQMDPRVHATAQDLQQQFEISQRLAEAISHCFDLLGEVRGVREELHRRLTEAPAEEAEKLNQLDSSTAELLGSGGFGVPGLAPTGSDTLVRLNAQLGAVYTSVNRADAAPTAAQSAAAQQLREQLARLEARWTQLKAQESGILKKP